METVKLQDEVSQSRGALERAPEQARRAVELLDVVGCMLKKALQLPSVIVPDMLRARSSLVPLPGQD